VNSDAIAVLQRAGHQAFNAGALATARQRFEAAVVAGRLSRRRDLLLTLAGVLLATGDAPATGALCRRMLHHGWARRQ